MGTLVEMRMQNVTLYCQRFKNCTRVNIRIPGGERTQAIRGEYSKAKIRSRKYLRQNKGAHAVSLVRIIPLVLFPARRGRGGGKGGRGAPVGTKDADETT